jgi:hypothetical protein
LLTYQIHPKIILAVELGLGENTMYRFIGALLLCFILAGELNGQWEILNQGTTEALNAIDFVSENVGWIAGDEGILLKTEDNGQTWRFLPQYGN